MSVENDNPITIEAQPAKTYDKLWVGGLLINAPNFTECRVNTTLKPYTDENGVYEFAPATVGKVVRFSDMNWFDLHTRKPWCEEAVHNALAGMGITVPNGVPATLFLMEILARSCGAVAQAVPPESSSSHSSQSSASSESSDPTVTLSSLSSEPTA